MQSKFHQRGILQNNTSQNFQSYQRQGEYEKLSQPRGA